VTASDKATFSNIRTRLRHVLDFIEHEGNLSLSRAQLDEAWANRFRKWLAARPFYRGKETVARYRNAASVEVSLSQLAAAVGQVGYKVRQQKDLVTSPTFRADIETLARMFTYALDNDKAELLKYLRAGVATWARPDAILDLQGHQFISAAGVLHLNPPGRPQTRKRRPTIPVARQFRPHLDGLVGPYMGVASIRSSWQPMRDALGLPSDGQAGWKLTRRSMATLARRRLGEEHWIQGQIMLGHVKQSISDIYAVPETGNLGRALAVTEEIIDEIEQKAPGAFTAKTPQRKS
jgi:hypothetical protein